MSAYNDRLKLASQIENEVADYLKRPVSISQDHDFSQAALIRRISLFENKIYPTGKFDSQGNYKFWFDIIGPRIESEIKNIDFDTKDIEAYSPRKIDDVPNLITNLKIKEYLRDTGQAEELNSAIEEGSGWGNVVWKKVKGGYERVDLKNFYVINQTAQSLKETAVIERHQLTQSELRERASKWQNIDEVIRSCGQNIYKSDLDATQQDTTTPMYTIYERNGEVSLQDLKEYRGEAPADGDEDLYVFAKVIAAGTEGTSAGVQIKYILFADDLPGKNNEKLYKEYHRGRYKGRWFREGLYELLFDVQVRANEIGNQIAQGLQYASKVIFTGEDKQIIQNVITDLKNGDYLKGKDLRQVEVRMHGFDQLLADWNRIIQTANEIANSREVVQGVTPASGTPLGTTQLLNENAGKLFDFIREKLSIPIREIFEEWIIPDLIKQIEAQDVLRLTGDFEMMNRLREILIENWYIDNLLSIGPHTEEVARALKDQKMEELQKDTAIFLKEFKQAFANYQPRVSVVITGENTNRRAQGQTLAQFIGFEADPIRRTALVEEAMRHFNVDVGGLPKSKPQDMQQPAPDAQKPDPRKVSAAPALAPSEA